MALTISSNITDVRSWDCTSFVDNPEAEICGMHYNALLPAAVEVPEESYWGTMKDGPSKGGPISKISVGTNVNPPYANSSSDTLLDKVSGTGWTADITWTAADPLPRNGTASAVFEIKATGAYFFEGHLSDPEDPESPKVYDPVTVTINGNEYTVTPTDEKTLPSVGPVTFGPFIIDPSLPMISNLSVPKIPYSGNPLPANSAFKGTGWEGSNIVWNPTTSPVERPDVYTVTFTATATGKYFFDNETPVTVSTTGSGSDVNTYTVTIVDSTQANVSITYLAVANEPPKVGNGFLGYILQTSYNDFNARNQGGEDFDSKDPIFVQLDPDNRAASDAMVEAVWNKGGSSTISGTRMFYIAYNRKVKSVLEPPLDAEVCSDTTGTTFTRMTVTIDGVLYHGAMNMGGPQQQPVDKTFKFFWQNL